MDDFDPLYDWDGSEEEILPIGCAVVVGLPVAALLVAGGFWL